MMLRATDAALLDVTCCVRLHTLLQFCCVLLGVVVQSFKAVKLLARRKLPTILGVVAQQKLRPFARGLDCLDSEPAHIL